MSEFERQYDVDEPQPLTDLLALTYVPRWSVVPMLRSQSVAEHTHRVQVIVMELCKRLELKNNHVLGALLWALYHDGDESRTGDIQSNFKRIVEEVEQAATTRTFSRATQLACPWYADLKMQLAGGPAGEVAAAVVKLADQIEMVTWLQMWGNLNSRHVDHIKGKLAITLRSASNRLSAAIMADEGTGEPVVRVWHVANDIRTEIIAEAGRRTDPK